MISKLALALAITFVAMGCSPSGDPAPEQGAAVEVRPIEAAGEPVAEPEPGAETESEPETVDDVGRDTISVTFNLEPDFVAEPMPATFDYEVFDVDRATELLGSLDASGTIKLPRDRMPTNLMIQAETPNDPFCWWTAFIFVGTGDNGRAVDLELFQECA